MNRVYFKMLREGAKLGMCTPGLVHDMAYCHGGVGGCALYRIAKNGYGRYIVQESEGCTGSFAGIAVQSGFRDLNWIPDNQKNQALWMVDLSFENYGDARDAVSRILASSRRTEISKRSAEAQARLESQRDIVYRN